MSEEIEQTLYVCRDASVFKIPPRVGAGGYRSGEWRVADKIFTGRVKVVAKGDDCEVRLEDPNNNGALFASCPVPKGQRHIAVEQASDSSRNFVLRLLDPSSGRHAFVGLSFAERGEAFDFNVALADHEKHSERAAAFQQVSGSGVAAAGGGQQQQQQQQETIAEAELLYKKQDLSLKSGQTIKINMGSKSGDKPGGGFLSKLGATSGGGGGGGLMPLAPPPATGTAPALGLAPPPQAAAAAAPGANPWGTPAAAAPAAGGTTDLLGGFGAPAQQQQQPPAARDGWATFE